MSAPTTASRWALVMVPASTRPCRALLRPSARAVAGSAGDVAGVAGVAGAAAALGTDAATLRQALQDGKSIADVAADKSVAVDTVVKAISDAVTAKIDQAVTDGKLTRAQADTAKAALAQRITDLVNAKGMPGMGGAGMGGHGPRGDGDGDGDGPGAPATTTPTTTA